MEFRIRALAITLGSSAMPTQRAAPAHDPARLPDRDGAANPLPRGPGRDFAEPADLAPPGLDREATRLALRAALDRLERAYAGGACR